MSLISLAQPQQNLVGLVHRWLRNLDWLETPGNCIHFSEVLLRKRLMHGHKGKDLIDLKCNRKPDRKDKR